jgi:transcription-repair coupling factor (superfamily II helicase)
MSARSAYPRPVLSRPTSVADVVDPGSAAGALAAVLRHGREPLEYALDGDELVVPPSARAFVLSLLSERAAPLLVVTPRSSDAEALADGLAAFLGEDRVAVFPAWETLPHERLSPQASTVGRRLAVIDRLVRPEGHDEPLLAVVAPIRAALQPMDPALGRRAPITLDDAWRGTFDGLVEGLAELGYARVPQVQTRGEFAVRGGLVDVFPTAADHAVRVEFWGDDIESMRAFGVGDQRSVGRVDRVVVDPARELVIDDEVRARARDMAARLPSLREHLDKLADGLTFEGVESLVTLLHPRPALLPQFLPSGAGLAVVDPLVVRDRATKLHEEARVLLETAWETAAGHRPDDDGFATVDELLDCGDCRSWQLGPFGDDKLPGTPWASFRGDVAALSEQLRGHLGDGLRVVVSAVGEGTVRRLSEVFAEHGLPSTVVSTVGSEPQYGRVEVVPSPLREGFLAAGELGLALLGEWDVFGPRRAPRAGRRMGSRASAAETVLALAEGDPVVHRTHGVGIYRGMITREVAGPTGETAKKDYVTLEYAKGDTLFVPSDQVDAIAKYQGGEKPSVMSLGGAQWERAKNRVRKAVRDIAADLIRLYAARLHAPGHAFDPDGAMQRELEDAFPHVETSDQLVVIDQIKRDMEAPEPMDRLLAGDVGFGKTEVAVRAAGKAVFDGKQVAVLVPTTILAQQHFETFRERFLGFPVEVRMVSRFVPDTQRKATLDGLAAGTVDIVVGTHALLSKQVRWKDLGLVVVDEEQRFGVSQKERLKQLRTSVDVLSMSATPIPRTLEMAVTGIRDMSVIETPPEDRQPVMTIVQEYDDAQVALAIRREMLRDGQVFYLHNQVDTIHEAAAAVREMVPDARVEVAHGQMEERQLERVMIRFWEREFDVLVCTTIIESGLDVPNANTLVIERADLLGLAQLHQLRGRVGRSSERAYAYFLYPRGASITEPAYERLKTVSEHSRLGSGLSIALRDLELRGAGNVVGAEQSGQVAAVGFDMYAQLLKEEVAQLRGEPVEEEVEIKLELPVDAHLPKDYVEDEQQRLELYKKISAVRDAAGVKAVTAELADRFGPLPPPAEKLLTLAAVKAAMRRWGVTEATLTTRNMLRLAPVHLQASQEVRLERSYPGYRYKSDGGVLQVPLPRQQPDDLVAWVAATLRDVLAKPKARA